MSHVLNRATVALTALAVAAGGALIGCACSGRPHHVIQVRQADLIAPSDTAGRRCSRSSSPKVCTSRPTNRRRQLRARPLPRAASRCRRCTSVDYTWYGTDVRAGRLATTSTSTATARSTASSAASSTYGGQDVWLNLDAQDFPRLRVLADNFFATVGTVHRHRRGARRHRPVRLAPAPAPEHGTLDHWASAGSRPPPARPPSWSRRLLARRRLSATASCAQSPTAPTSTSSPTTAKTKVNGRPPRPSTRR